ncbi:MAG: DUF1385 domain-containing protein [Deltaproteobacteria bacterium]|nr:DUF1385 domain-containing protein [Deltaproteobacteria bacterium]
MMRAPRACAVAVRRKDGSIVVSEQPIIRFLSRYRVFRWPLLRGAVILIESLHNGMVALTFAAEQASLDDESAPQSGLATPPNAGALLAVGDAGSPPPPAGLSKAALWGTMAFAIVLGLLFFVGLPHLLTYLLGLLVPGGLDVDSGWFHLIDGLFKLALFIGYVALIGRMPDIRRLFMYHGAEHKSVHAFEAKLPLEVAPARPFSTAHPRCGTSLIMWVVAISVFMFAAVLPFVPRPTEITAVNQVYFVLVKILLTLPIAGIAYELQRAASRRPDNRIIQTLIAPGMWLQSLTTRPPGDPELEVALSSLRAALWREQRPEAPGERQPPRQFADFQEVVSNYG